MELRFMGKENDSRQSPTLYHTDEVMYGKETCVFQGGGSPIPTLARLDIPEH